MVTIGSGTSRRVRDYMLTRYACYPIAMNVDPGKQEIAFAQSYFALSTRKIFSYTCFMLASKRVG